MIFNEENLHKTVIKLAIPAVAEQALFMVVGIVSTVFVGHISKEAISAVGLVNFLSGFLIALFTALSTGCTVLVARLIGEKDVAKARETVRQSVFLGVLISVTLSLLCYILAEPMIRLFYNKADPEVINLATVYFRITLTTTPLMLLNVIIGGGFRGAGDMKLPMLIGYVVNILNIILNFILIFGVNLPFIKIPGYGIVGAGYAVAISRGIGGILSIASLYIPGSVIRTNIIKNLKIDFEIVKRMLTVGIPATVEQIIMQGGFLAIQVVISAMGTVSIAVYQIVMSINSICFIPIWGFGTVALTMIGQGLGAKKPQFAEKSGWVTLKIAIISITFLTIIVYAFANPIIAAYSQDLEVIKLGITAIRIFSFSQPFLAVVVVFSWALRGAGDINYVMVTTLVGIWGFRFLVLVLLDWLFGIGINGVWIAFCMDFFIRAIMYYLRFRRGAWKEITV